MLFRSSSDAAAQSALGARPPPSRAPGGGVLRCGLLQGATGGDGWGGI